MTTDDTAVQERPSPENVRAGFATRLRAALEAKNWSQSDLSRKTGISKDAVSTWCRGRSIPGDQNLRKIARALGVKVEELLTERPVRRSQFQQTVGVQTRTYDDTRILVEVGACVMPRWAGLLLSYLTDPMTDRDTVDALELIYKNASDEVLARAKKKLDAEIADRK